MAKPREKRTYCVAQVTVADSGRRILTTCSFDHANAEQARRAARRDGTEGEVYAVIAICGEPFHVNIETRERRTLVPVDAEEKADE